MNRLPTELKLAILTSTAKTNLSSLHALSSINRTYHSVFKQNRRRLLIVFHAAFVPAELAVITRALTLLPKVEWRDGGEGCMAACCQKRLMPELLGHIFLMTEENSFVPEELNEKALREWIKMYATVVAVYSAGRSLNTTGVFQAQTLLYEAHKPIDRALKGTSRDVRVLAAPGGDRAPRESDL